MAKFVFLVRTGPSSPERTDEYNDWYDNVHLPDLLNVKGVVGASRYRVAKAQQGGPVEGDVPARDPDAHVEVEVRALLAQPVPDQPGDRCPHETAA